MNRVLLLIMAEARRATELRIRVTMLRIAHTSTNMIGVLRTKHNLGITMHNKDIGSLSLSGIGRTLTVRPASGLAGQLAHVLVAALEVSAASLISGSI